MFWPLRSLSTASVHSFLYRNIASTACLPQQQSTKASATATAIVPQHWIHAALFRNSQYLVFSATAIVHSIFYRNITSTACLHQQQSTTATATAIVPQHWIHAAIFRNSQYLVISATAIHHRSNLLINTSTFWLLCIHKSINPHLFESATASPHYLHSKLEFHSSAIVPPVAALDPQQQESTRNSCSGFTPAMTQYLEFLSQLSNSIPPQQNSTTADPQSQHSTALVPQQQVPQL